MIRVLEVFGEPISRGGQESYVMTALQHMDLSELHVDLFTPYYCDNQEYVQFVESNNGKVATGNMPFVVGGTRREVIPLFEKYLHDNKYDIVHIHSGSISILAYYAQVASKNGVRKVIVHSHSSGVKENVKHFFMKIYASRLFKKYVTDFCACSIEAAKWKFPKSVLSRVRILNNGIKLDKFKYDPVVRKAMRVALEIDDDTLVLGHVGRFTYEKNQIFLIDVLKNYIDKYPNRKVHLVLVGDGEEIIKVKQRAKALDVIEKVTFVGVSDRVNEYLQAMDIFLFPSLYEGLGIVGIEAQTAGLPVIASNKIPKMMKVTNNVVFINLSDIYSWCLYVEKYKCLNRNDNYDVLKKKGYDVNDTAKAVQEMYFS